MSGPDTPASWAVRVSRPDGAWRVELLAADAGDELPALERALGDPGAEDWPGPFVVVVDSRLYFVVLRHGPGGLVRALISDATMQEWLLAAEVVERYGIAVDADKTGYADYVDQLYPRMTPNGVVLLDNTLASGHVLIDGGRVRFRTRKAGVLEVRSGIAGYELDLPETLVEAAEHHALLDALGTPGGKVFLSVTGAESTAIILLEDEAAVRACAPDMSKLGAIELMAIVTAPGDTHDVVSRVFVPAWGVDEDPVTGSAHAALTPFWCERLGRDSFSAFQASRRGGAVQCRRVGDRTVLGGGCVTVLEGTLRF